MADTLRCPNCSFEIEVSTVLAAQLRQALRQEFETRARQKDRELSDHEEKLREKERTLEASRQALEQEVLKRVAQQREALLEDAKERARESLALEMKDLNAQLIESKSKLEAAQAAELELRKERRELETQKQELELAVNRRLDEERDKIRQETMRQAEEENRLHDADQQKLIDDLRRQIGDLKRTSELGSQQAQGEVMELELEELLRQHFPQDGIEAIPRGTHGRDVLQRVHDHHGKECGTILWESKRTKAWNDGWLPKLRDDQRAARAHLAALLTAEMPKELALFGCRDGVWVTSRACLVGMAAALRAGLLEVARAKRSLDGQNAKIEMLHNYFSGPEFTQRVQGIAEALISMKHDLESERRCFQRLWAKRQKQIDRATMNTAGLYGDVGGILGDKLPQLLQLELAAITEDASDPELTKAPWE
jgi:hypothetical protein